MSIRRRGSGFPRLSGRAAIQSRMRAEFEHAGVWDLMRKRIPASDYTRPGDPLRIDAGLPAQWHRPDVPCGQPGGGTGNGQGAGFFSGGTRAGVKRVEDASLELTAVIEPAKIGRTDEEPERLAMYRFGVETMEEHRIRVLTTADLGRVADTARRELRV